MAMIIEKMLIQATTIVYRHIGADGALWCLDGLQGPIVLGCIGLYRSYRYSSGLSEIW